MHVRNCYSEFDLEITAHHCFTCLLYIYKGDGLCIRGRFASNSHCATSRLALPLTDPQHIHEQVTCRATLQVSQRITAGKCAEFLGVKTCAAGPSAAARFVTGIGGHIGERSALERLHCPEADSTTARLAPCTAGSVVSPHTVHRAAAWASAPAPPPRAAEAVPATHWYHTHLHRTAPGLGWHRTSWHHPVQVVLLAAESGVGQRHTLAFDATDRRPSDIRGHAVACHTAARGAALRGRCRVVLPAAALRRRVPQKAVAEQVVYHTPPGFVHGAADGTAAGGAAGGVDWPLPVLRLPSDAPLSCSAHAAAHTCVSAIQSAKKLSQATTHSGNGTCPAYTTVANTCSGTCQ